VISRIKLRPDAKMKRLAESSGEFHAFPRNFQQMETIANEAINTIKNRFTKRGVDGDGKRAHPLKDRGWFFTDARDQRFAGKLKHIKRKDQQPMLIDPKGYKSVKRKMGKSPKRTGSLTGAMWDSFKPKIKRKRGGWLIEATFTGAQLTYKKETGKFKKKVIRYKRTKTGKLVQIRKANDPAPVAKTKIRKIPILKSERTPNRMKAYELQLKDRKGSPKFDLLSLSEKEIERLADRFVALIMQTDFWK
tara:strand:+ start:82 stop:825 length:744 start_codon:yes stop_codon:yes gene_type:complete